MTMFKALMWNEWLLTKRGLTSLVMAIALPSCFFLFSRRVLGRAQLSKPFYETI